MSEQISKCDNFSRLRKGNMEEWMGKWSFIVATVLPPKPTCIKQKGTEFY